MMWFGLVAGWLNLGLVLAQGALRPHVATARVRTNLHFWWMIPASDALVFGVVGLALALATRPWPRLARWTAWRAPIAMLFLALLLEVEGLYQSAALFLACGLALRIGPLIDGQAERFGRLIRLSFPALALGTAASAWLIHERVESAEERALAAAAPARPGAPNVLLLVLDTVRAECLSLHGHDRTTTPNIDRLASRGVLFTQARTTAPWTAPAHASLMTGRWPHELSVAPGEPLDASFPTLAEVLGREGYATAGFIGNIYCCNGLYGIGRGFARYEDAYENQAPSFLETLYSSGLGRRVLQTMGHPMDPTDEAALPRKTAEMLNRDMLGWLDQRPADRPFFAFINYYDAHRPYRFYTPPESRFGKAALSPADQEALERTCFEAIAGRPGDSGLTPEQAGQELTQFYHDAYDTCIAYIDQQLGLLFDEMERKGLLENTLIVVTSDHGEEIGERGRLVHGASVYSTEAHVPLVVVPPSRWSGPQVVAEPVSLRDVPATIAQWTGLGASSPFPGHPLTQLAANDQDRPATRSPVLCELEHIIAFPLDEPVPPPFGPARSLVARDRIYIRRPEGSEELYDLRFDPMEIVDLAKDPGSAPTIEQFRQELDQLRRDEAVLPTSLEALPKP
ncbi:sulfatase [Paludisphaera rhizosphaerae]|nr:sulfatase [Paludisphaera rhizosphaerae]